MTASTLTLPSTRNIAAYGYNEQDDIEDETYVLEIEDAIAAGRLLGYVTGHERRSNSTPVKEVDLTCFRDPRAGEIRYAVKIWNDGRTGTYDYADRKKAVDSANEWVQLIGVRSA
ncbi:hypothetical protein AB0E08_08335 [Streptomyces sp. NPDC048281]|uniref:hypothetical protein n=1 Tax=Streptomyces sp. NPDC048281 TaxID=3154715 RepID=UPI003417C7D8